jgi:hypothetical protein
MKKNCDDLNGGSGGEKQDSLEFSAFFEELKKQYPNSSKTEARALYKIEQKKAKLKQREKSLQSKIGKKQQNKHRKSLERLGYLVETIGNVQFENYDGTEKKGLLTVSEQVLVGILYNEHLNLQTITNNKLQKLQKYGEKMMLELKL